METSDEMTWSENLFSLSFHLVSIGQPIMTTPRGTKVIFRTDYQNLEANRAYFGDFDPFGDSTCSLERPN